jgi:hypothetical protein
MKKMKSYINFQTISILLISLIAIGFNSCDKIDCPYENKIEELNPPCTEGIDLVFLIDYTNSMGNVIEDIKSSATSIVASINSQSGGNYRLALSIFDEYKTHTPATYESTTAYSTLAANQKIIISSGITSNQYLTVLETFSSSNMASFNTQLQLLNTIAFPLGEGAQAPEPGGLLLNEIMVNSFAGAWRPGVAKIAIIITDNNPGGDDDTYNSTDDAYLQSLASIANTMGVQCILVTNKFTGNSAYETQLIANNIGSSSVMGVNVGGEEMWVDDIGGSIIDVIENLCDSIATEK